MKLKLISLAIIINILLSLPCADSWGGLKAQTWCPAGATWHYEYNDIWSTGYYKIEYKNDTIIAGFSCRKMSKTFYTYNYIFNSFDTLHLADEYTYSDADKVYLYRFNDFYTLYDFSANVGDVWEVAGTNKYSFASCDSVGFVKVDSIGTMSINGNILRYVCVSPTVNSKWGWVGKVVEKIGPIINYSSSLETYNYLFPNKLDFCGMNVDESHEAGFLRCYYDSVFGSYSTQITPSCEFLATDIKENKNETVEFTIAPNPFYNESVIKYSIKKQYQTAEFVINDSFGEKIKMISIADKQGTILLDRADFKNGIYVCTVSIDGKIVCIEKMIVVN
ncbi:MAG: hypothetical protein WBM13_00210 [Bacteroidia bacterium]